MTSSDVLIETLMDWGVEHIFGIPGEKAERDREHHGPVPGFAWAGDSGGCGGSGDGSATGQNQGGTGVALRGIDSAGRAGQPGDHQGGLQGLGERVDLEEYPEKTKATSALAGVAVPVKLELTCLRRWNSSFPSRPKRARRFCREERACCCPARFRGPTLESCRRPGT